MWIQTLLHCAKQYWLGLFQDFDCAGDLEDSKSTSDETLCIIHMFQSVGCLRNKLQFHTVHQNQKSFPWRQDWGWRVFPHLIYGIWSSQFFTETRVRVIKYGETCVRINVRFVQCLTHFKNERNLMEWSATWTQLILFLQTSVFASRSFVWCVWR